MKKNSFYFCSVFFVIMFFCLADTMASSSSHLEEEYPINLFEKWRHAPSTHLSNVSDIAEGISLVYSLNAPPKSHLFLSLGAIENEEAISSLEYDLTSTMHSISLCNASWYVLEKNEAILQKNDSVPYSQPDERMQSSRRLSQRMKPVSELPFNELADLFKGCGSLVSLEMINIDSCQLTDQDIRQLIDFKQHFLLKVLSLKDNQVTGQTIADILSLKGLTYLNLRNNPLNERNPNPWKNRGIFPHLVFLDLSETGMNDEALYTLIESLKKSLLKKLFLDSNYITGINQGKYTPTSEKNFELEELSLSNNQISYEGLKDLAEAGFLSTVSLNLANNNMLDGRWQMRVLVENDSKFICWSRNMKKLTLYNNNVWRCVYDLFKEGLPSLKTLNIESDEFSLMEVLHVVQKAPLLNSFSVKIMKVSPDLRVSIVDPILEKVHQIMERYKKMDCSEENMLPIKKAVYEEMHAKGEKVFTLWPKQFDLKLSKLFPFLKQNITQELNDQIENEQRILKGILPYFESTKGNLDSKKLEDNEFFTFYKNWKDKCKRERERGLGLWSVLQNIVDVFILDPLQQIKGKHLLGEMTKYEDQLISMEKKVFNTELSVYLIGCIKKGNSLYANDLEKYCLNQKIENLNDFLYYSCNIMKERVELGKFIEFMKTHLS